MCVCVCVREREIERDRQTETVCVCVCVSLFMRVGLQETGLPKRKERHFIGCNLFGCLLALSSVMKSASSQVPGCKGCTQRAKILHSESKDHTERVTPREPQAHTGTEPGLRLRNM